MITPNISFSYQPDFSDPVFGYYQEIEDTSGQVFKRDRFLGSNFGGTASNAQRNINFSASNVFQMKRLIGDKEKKYDLLNYNGYFLNIEVTTSNNEKYNQWYIDLWSEWIKKYQNQYNTQTKFEEIPYIAPNKPENHFDPLEIQLNYLKEVGFIEVECHYKYGLFTIYGGKK